MNKNKALKIIVPLLMLAVIAGIWFLSNKESLQKEDEVLETPKPNFEMEITSLDMAELKALGLPIIIDFGSDGCGPCQTFHPILEACHEEVGEKALIKYIDVWENPEAAAEFPVTVIPTQAFFNADGSPYVPSEEVSKGIFFATYNHKETGEHIYTMHVGGLRKDEMDLILKDLGVDNG